MAAEVASRSEDTARVGLAQLSRPSTRSVSFGQHVAGDSRRGAVIRLPMMTVPESFRRMPRWFAGPTGRDWLDALQTFRPLVPGHHQLD